MMFTVFANWKCRPNGTMKEYVPNDQFIHQWGLIEPSAHLFIQRIHRDDLEDYRRSLWCSIKHRTGFVRTYRFQTTDGFKMMFSCGEPWLIGNTYVGHAGFDLLLGDGPGNRFTKTVGTQLKQNQTENHATGLGSALNATTKGNSYA